MSLKDEFQRMASFATSALDANLRDLPLPYRLFLYVTDACNCKCNMCNIWQRDPQGEMTTAEFVQVLEKARDHLKWLDISGGEIFLKPGIEDLFAYCADELPHLLLFHFATNGLLTKEIVRNAERIRDSAIPRFMVTVSLDGPPALHNEIRGVPNAWRQALKTYKALSRLGGNVEVVFGMTLTQHNKDKFQATVEAVQAELPQVSPQDFHVNIAQVSNLYYDNAQLIDEPEASLQSTIDAISNARGHSLHPVNWLERAFLFHARAFLRTGKSPLTCEALSSSCVVGPRGDLHPCIMYDVSAGNVRDYGYSIGQLWGEARRKALRDEIRQGKCPQCWTPCEAYQTLLAHALPWGKSRPPGYRLKRAGLLGRKTRLA